LAQSLVREKEAQASPAVQVNKSGQSLGRKGHRTRQRIIDATRELMEDSKGVAPSAAAVARAADISSPTFYLYFGDVGEAILAVVEQAGDDLAPVRERLEAPWGADPFLQAHAFVQSFFDYWTEHAAVLRVRNRMADAGDERFVALRLAYAVHLLEPLVRKLSPVKSKGTGDIPARAIAGALIVNLERSATVSVLQIYPKATQTPDMINALALQFTWALAR
jgi:AcrR family transcriptional regulator